MSVRKRKWITAKGEAREAWLERFDRYEAMVEDGLAEAVMRLGLPLG